MKRKRLLCAILALVLLCAAQPAVLAAEEISNKRTTNLTALMKLPVVKVSVPTSGVVYINPLNLSVSIGDWNRGDQIISTPATIANLSDAPIVVDVTVTASVRPESDMTLASEPTGGAGTEKKAFVYFEIVQSIYINPNYASWGRTYDPEKHIALVDGVPQTRKGILTLPPTTLDGDIASRGYAPFRLTGDAVREPTTAWTRMDGITVTVAFTFTPIPYDEYVP